MAIFRRGYAEHFYVILGSTIYKVPLGLPIEIVAGANCALSQVIVGFERANLSFDETVVIQVAGGLGLYATAVAKAFGARLVVVLDAVGDLSLAGAALNARYVAHRPGHALNNRVLRALFADSANWRTVFPREGLDGWEESAAADAVAA